MTPSIHLGFECSTGYGVSIPLHHLVATGVTQASGKTTTLEALVTRSGYRAIVFSTKRGERDFPTAHEVRPYFRERVDWQYVQSLLEATMSERLKFERSWIIQVSHGARSLAQVHANVQDKLASAKGLSQSVYTNLNAYLNLVLPEIRQARLANKLELGDGLNIMQLGHLRTEVQALVIQSVIDEILHNYNRTIVVIPEAWKFLPRGRGSPVKKSAEAFIRQGAVLHKFLWIDSQDCAGIETSILKSIDVWLLGRQREKNEIKRMIDQIPVRPKPKPEMIATLDLGQFVACFGNEVCKVYVQPSWMDWGTAQGIATGQTSMNAALEKVEKPEVPKERIAEELGPAEVLEVEDMGRIQELELELAKAKREIERLQFVVVPEQTEDLSKPLVESVVSEVLKRLKTKPEVLRVLTVQPVIEINHELVTVEVDSKELRGRIARLIHDGWFDNPRTNRETVIELNRRGSRIMDPAAWRQLAWFVETEFLERVEKDKYKALRSEKSRLKLKAGN